MEDFINLINELNSDDDIGDDYVHVPTIPTNNHTRTYNMFGEIIEDSESDCEDEIEHNTQLPTFEDNIEEYYLDFQLKIIHNDSIFEDYIIRSITGGYTIEGKGVSISHTYNDSKVIISIRHNLTEELALPIIREHYWASHVEDDLIHITSLSYYVTPEYSIAGDYEKTTPCIYRSRAKSARK